MANPEHLKLLQQGVDVWNEWRAKERGTVPGLSGTNLYRADLRGANLSWANISEANPILADLTGSYLIGSDLTRTNLWDSLVGRVIEGPR